MEKFILLAQCIRSGQVPDHEVPQLLKDNPAFAEWYLKLEGKPV